MLAKFIQDGDVIDYRPTVDTPAGTVVVREDLIGVTKRSILAGELGVLHLTGVFELPKETGNNRAIAFGKRVFWHEPSGQVRRHGGGGGLGHAAQETDDDDPTIRVRLGPHS